MLNTTRFLTLFATLLVVSGCANYHTEKYFERDANAVAASKSIAGSNERATVYFFRPKVPLQSISYLPVPPLYYAVDGQLLAVMPTGSYVVLSLNPGSHTFSRIFAANDIMFGAQVKQADARIDLAAGKTYYVGGGGFWGASFGLVDAEAARAVLADAELAKFIHRPLSVDAFLASVASSGKKDSPARQKVPPTPLPAGNSVSLADALPSAKQVGSFLEGLAAVALIGLVVVAAVAGASSSNAAQYTPPNHITSPPIFIQQSVIQQPTQARVWQNSSGTLSEIVQSKTEVIVNNLSTGVRYRIEDGRITGSDGSRYRVMGSNIFADTGQSYQVVGNSLFASDGHSCEKIGNMITCRVVADRKLTHL